MTAPRPQDTRKQDEDDIALVPYKIVRYIRAKIKLIGRAPVLPIEDGTFGSSADSALPSVQTIQHELSKPRRKGLGPKQLAWLRKHNEPFADMERRAKASKLVAAKGKRG